MSLIPSDLAIFRPLPAGDFADAGAVNRLALDHIVDAEIHCRLMIKFPRGPRKTKATNSACRLTSSRINTRFTRSVFAVFDADSQGDGCRAKPILSRYQFQGRHGSGEAFVSHRGPSSPRALQAVKPRAPHRNITTDGGMEPTDW